MKKIIIFLFYLVPFINYGQDWLVVDILKQNKKEIIYRIDDGDSVKRKKDKNPSIVKLIHKYQEDGYELISITQGVELDLNGNIPMAPNGMNRNFITNLTLQNNNRIMLWFRKSPIEFEVPKTAKLN